MITEPNAADIADTWHTSGRIMGIETINDIVEAVQ